MRYYVNSSYTGAVSNGQKATPWKSLSAVQSNMGLFVAGDVISFKTGQTFTGNLNVTKSGTALLPITFNSYGNGPKPKFTGTGSYLGTLFSATNRAYLVFDNLQITDPTISPTDRTVEANIDTVFQFDGSTNNCIIRNCDISLCGVGAYLTGNNNTMTLTTVSNMRMVKNTPGGNDDYGANGIVISSANNTVSYCTFDGCWAVSYDYGYDGGAIEYFGNGASNNTVSYCVINDCNGVCENGSSNGGTIQNNVFAYNKITNNGKLFYINNSGTFQVTVSNFQYYNNVVVENVVNRLGQTYMGSIANTVATPNIVVFKNNVIQLTSGISFVSSNQFNSGQMVHTNNVYNVTNGGNIGLTLGATEISTQAAYWTNTTNSNPKLWNYYPLANGVLIDAGTNLGYTTDFDGYPVGNPPDIGVLQNNTITPPDPGPTP